MAKQGNWNKSFWKKLDKLSDIDMKELYHELSTQTDFTRSMMEALTPVKFGGLVASRYAICEMQGTKIKVRAGYTHTPHWDLDPADPHQDDMTNPQLLQYLIENVNDPAKSAVLYKIQDWMDELRYNCVNITKDYFKKQIRR